MRFDEEAAHRIVSDPTLGVAERIVAIAVLHMLELDELGLELPTIATIARATGRTPAQIANLLQKLRDEYRPALLGNGGCAS